MLFMQNKRDSHAPADKGGLAWAPGSIDTILAGGEPNALSHVPTEELLLELRRRIVAHRDRRRDTWDDFDRGMDPQGDWPDEG